MSTDRKAAQPHHPPRRIAQQGNGRRSCRCAEFRRTLALACGLLLAGTAQLPTARADDARFPFVVAYETPDNVTNLSEWLDKPAGKQGPVRVRDGKFLTDAGPIRFLGTNLCFDACFPTHKQAEALSRRLARFGINVVRMHHMDSRSIWGRSPNKLTIDPQQFERLDYLIWSLKQQGIYTNLNLHVSRSLGPAEGFDDPALRPKYDKGVGNFEPRMIALQKQYAHDLLTHVNPYTQTAYTDEPAIAFVEISNEDALFTEWFRGHLQTLPDPYARTFQELWTDWLAEKYKTTDRLRAAWREGEEPLGAELLTNGSLQSGTFANWNLEQDGPDQAAWSIEEHRMLGTGRFLQLVVHQPGTVSWRPQLTLSGFAVRGGQAYTLRFLVRTDTPRSFGVNCMMAHAPWQRLGLSTRVAAERHWQLHQFAFVATADDENARITFTDLKPGTYEMAEVSLRPGGVTGLLEYESLENGVAVLSRDQTGRTPQVRADFLDFLYDLERDYWLGLFAYLKDELGVAALVSGTQLSYSPVSIQSQLDYIDAHAYWQHPRFPNRPWDPEDWYVVNAAMVNAPGGTLVDLAARRVAGLPFTVSEYNHPAPLQYAAEGLPMLASMAGLQGWNGIYSFTWSHNTEFEPDALTGFFDIKSDPGKLVHHPACAALFVRGDMPRAQQTVAVPITPAAERAQLHATGGDPWSLQATEFGLSTATALRHAIGLSLEESAGERTESSPAAPADQESAATHFASDHAALTWKSDAKDRGLFLVDTPRTKLVTGFVDGDLLQLGDVTLRIAPGKLGWATLSMTCLDGSGFDAPGRVLIAATGAQQNTGWTLQDLGQHRVTLGRNWGEGPVLCEGISATIALPVAANRVALFPLDTAGNRRDAVPLAATPAGDRAQIGLSPEHRTLWYELVIE